MAPQEKKWDSAAERDLCIAIIQASQDENRVRYNWARVHAIMLELGYSFTKDAMSQHLTKTIMKDFKARHGKDATKSDTAALTSTPKKATKATPKATSSSKKRSKVKSAELVDDDELDEIDDPTPTKKVKADPDAAVKKENQRAQRERTTSLAPSATPADNEVDFQRWLNDDAVF